MTATDPDVKWIKPMGYPDTSLLYRPEEVPTRPTFDDNAKVLLEKRYMMKDPNGHPLEGETDLLHRVSMGIRPYYEIMAQGLFLPNTPTIVNLGTGNPGTFSACFKFDVDDDLHDIMMLGVKAADVLKWGGGVGYAWGKVRPRGAPVQGTSKKAGGVVSFMKVFHQIAKTVEQGGVRPGAQMAILPVDHGDILDFISSKDTPAKAEELSTFNISVAAPDWWMGKIDAVARHTRNITEVELGDSDQDGEESKAIRMFQQIVEGAWQTGDPGFYFIDTSEGTNPTPWAGKLTGTNPCGEVPLLDNEPCNLGSINLGKFVIIPPANPTLRAVDWNKLRLVARIATRFLDDILDANQFPHPSIDYAARYTRKLGLGVMGWADMLAMLGIDYDTDEAVRLGDKVMEEIAEAALDESKKLGQEKGPAPAYEASKFVDPEEATFYHPMAALAREQFEDGELPRNTTRTCIAPTGTISILLDAMSGIEPYFDTQVYRYMSDGTLLKQDIKPIREGTIYPGHTPKLTNEIGYEWHLKHQAAFQSHVDLAVSKTINLPNSATREDIAQAYLSAWRYGCKGVTVFRDGCRDYQVLNSKARDTVSVVDGFAIVNDTPEDPARLEAAIARISAGLPPARRPLPVTRQSVTHKFRVGDQKGYLTVGMYEDGRPGEVFIKCDREGSTVSGLLDTFGITLSKSLQYGIPLRELLPKLVGMRFEPAGWTENPEIRSATSIVDYVARWMLARYDRTEEKPDPLIIGSFVLQPDFEITLSGSFDTPSPAPVGTGLSCPDCGHDLIASDGCISCVANCGYSKCG